MSDDENGVTMIDACRIYAAMELARKSVAAIASRSLVKELLIEGTRPPKNLLNKFNSGNN